MSRKIGFTVIDLLQMQEDVAPTSKATAYAISRSEMQIQKTCHNGLQQNQPIMITVKLDKKLVARVEFVLTCNEPSLGPIGQ